MTNKKKPNNIMYQESMSTGKRVTFVVIGLLLIVTSIVSFLIDPIHIIMRYKTRITKDSMLYEVLQKPNLPGAYVQAYLFNITNADLFLAGIDNKLKIEEVGPFTYQEYRTNADLELDEELGVLRYSPKLFPRYVPEKSVADPKDVHLTLPNIAMLAIASMVSKSAFLTRVGFNMLAKQLESEPILKISAHEFLWGFDEPLINFGHKVMPGVIKFEKMGLLDRLYDIDDFRFEVGATTQDKFKIKTYNGEAGLTPLGYDVEPSRCNTFEDAYEGIIYPPDLTEETPLRLYRNVFCRIFNLQYRDTRTMDYGPEVFHYTFSDDSYSNNTDNICLCKNEDCVNGVSDISPCFFGLSFVLSNAHFLNADPALYERIEGIEPDEELHGSDVLVDPKLGAVLGTKLTLQLNVQVANVNFNSATSPFSDMIIPAAYFKIEQEDLDEKRKSNLWLVYGILPHVMHTAEAVFFIIGSVLLALVFKSFLPPLHMERINLHDFTQAQPLFNDKYKKNIKIDSH
ncbi:scavenger receptor class B member 1 [Pieris rapae]|uniref:scavenger receptor class B member 1 n=1 Tax=Pieris rapae TaxID=64459 RepID=UPI001E27E5F4|nr:scavenger receptor class B member 1 [Pieris rapae]XP_045485266.1 scavenger receptor class B member 1 [Pieris rapae]